MAPRNEENPPISTHGDHQQPQQQIYSSFAQSQQYIKLETSDKEPHPEHRNQITTLPTTVYNQTISAPPMTRYDSSGPCAGGPTVERFAATTDNKEYVMIVNQQELIPDHPSSEKKTFASLGNVPSLPLNSEFIPQSTTGNYTGYLQNQLYIPNNQFLIKNDPQMNTGRTPYSHSISYETNTEGY